MFKALALALALTGCSVIVDPIVIGHHPELPTPLQVCPVSWKVLVVDNQPWIATSYDDSLNMADCLNDTERYISQLMDVVCSYGSDKGACIATKEK